MDTCHTQLNSPSLAFLHENEYTRIVIYKNHSDAVEKSRYDSPERQTFVTEGWFTAGDFLQQQKNKSVLLEGNPCVHCLPVLLGDKVTDSS